MLSSLCTLVAFLSSQDTPQLNKCLERHTLGCAVCHSGRVCLESVQILKTGLACVRACKILLPLSPLTHTSDMWLLGYCSIMKHEAESLLVLLIWMELIFMHTHKRHVKAALQLCLSLCLPPLLSHLHSGLSLCRTVQICQIYLSRRCWQKESLLINFPLACFWAVRLFTKCEGFALHIIHSWLFKMRKTPYIVKVMKDGSAHFIHRGIHLCWFFSLYSQIRKLQIYLRITFSFWSMIWWN